MKRWSSDDGEVRMWTCAAGTVVNDGHGVLLAISQAEVRLSREDAAELAEVLIEATTGRVPA